MKSIDHYWYSQNPVAWLLLPLSWLFRGIVRVRKWMYGIGLFRIEKLSVPVIVIGNIAVGGTGKTPLLIALCELLRANGFKPGVVSRGYGAELDGEILLTMASTASEAGDEPVLVAQRTGCPVAVGRNRVAAARLLEQCGCDIVLSDDGLQHYRLHRDIEIAVVDAVRMHGNGFLLPAGPLREPLGRLQSVNFVVYNGHAQSVHTFSLEFSDAVNVTSGEHVDLRRFAGQQVHALAGIGNPQRFFDQLERADFKVTTHAYPDHHAYTETDLQEFADGSPVLMTEKDAVKCRVLLSQTSLKDHANRFWFLPVQARLSSQLNTDFIESMKNLVSGVAAL